MRTGRGLNIKSDNSLERRQGDAAVSANNQVRDILNHRTLTIGVIHPEEFYGGHLQIDRHAQRRGYG